MKLIISIGFSLLLLLLFFSQILNKQLESVFKQEINHLVRGELQYSNFSTSFFKNFPDLSIKFSHVILLNDTSKIDTLVKLESIQASISPFSIFDNQLNISTIKFNNAELFLDYLEKWQIFRKDWKPQRINIQHSEIQIPFSSWIYYRKKQKISYFPTFPIIHLDQIQASQRSCFPVLVRKKNQPDYSKNECVLFDLKQGKLLFEDSLGIFKKEGLNQINFYEQ